MSSANCQKETLTKEQLLNLHTDDAVHYLKEFEGYVWEQAASIDNDFRICRTVFKLYRLYPDRISSSVLYTVLLLSLLDETDESFLIIKYQMGDFFKNYPNVGKLLAMGDAISVYNMKKFWKLVKECRPILKDFPKFKEKVRPRICHDVSILYNRIKINELGERLGTSSAKILQHFINVNGWKFDYDKREVLIRDESAA